MQISNPAADFLNHSQIEVLKVLERAKPKVSGRTIAGMTEGVSTAQVNLVLRKFEELGIVDVQSVPPSKLYTLNRTHFGTQALLSLLNQFPNFLLEAKRVISNWASKPQAVWLFGSAAQGKASSASDIDLLFIWKKTSWETTAVADSLEAFLLWTQSATGNEPNLLNISMSELDLMIARKDALIGQLRRDAKVVWGATPEDLLAKR
jgi:predicted nucleotidyltransferase